MECYKSETYKRHFCSVQQTKGTQVAGAVSGFNHSSNDHHYNQFLHKQFHLINNSKVQYTPKHPCTDYFICRLFMNMLPLLQV